MQPTRPASDETWRPADADCHSRVWIEALGGSEVDFVGMLLDYGVSRFRFFVAGVDRVACRCDAAGQDHAGVDAVDEPRPVVARDVPVQLVERADIAGGEVEANRVVNAIADDDGAVSVFRAGNV